MDRFWDRLMWERLPLVVNHVSTIAARILLDGQWMRSLAWLPSWLPFLFLLLGGYVGATHPSALGYSQIFIQDRSFSSSFALTVAILTLGCFSARYAAFAIVGYIIGDVLFFNLPWYTHVARPVLTTFYLGLLVSYNLMFILGCIIPMVVRNLAVASTLGVENLRRAALAARVLVGAGYQYLFVYSWVALFPYLIRPLFTLVDPRPGWQFPQGGIGDNAVLAIRNTRELMSFTHPIVLAGVAAMALRLLLEQLDKGQGVEFPPGSPRRQRLATSIPAKTAYACFLFFGFAENWIGLILLVALLACYFILAQVLRTRLSGWHGAMERAPLLLRLFAGAVLSFLVADRMLPILIEKFGQANLMGIFLAGFAGSLIMLLLIRPGSAPRAKEQAEIAHA